MSAPAKPSQVARERLLDILAELIARTGSRSLLLPPIAPGDAAFPEPWAPTKVGVQLLLRRLVWHAGVDREVVIDDQRAGAPPTERKPSTRVELVEVRGKHAHFTLGFVGTDDVVGTLAHEVGTLYAVLHRPDNQAPYRSAEALVLAVDPDRDPERGGVAAVYCGLGVLATNAAYQHYSIEGRVNGAYIPHEVDVLKAGALPMSSLAYLVAVQAVVRGDDEPPLGLRSSQRDEVSAWMKALASDRRELRRRIGIEPSAEPEVRARAIVFPDLDDVREAAPRKTAFRWQTNRGGVGLLAGTVLGIGFSLVVSRGLVPFTAFGGAAAGHLVGRRVRAPRCSACATVVRQGATVCHACHAALRGDISSLSERLEAEERLEPHAAGVEFHDRV